MLFSVSEIDLLRLLRWCRYLSPDEAVKLFGKTELSNLITLKLVKLHKSSGTLILTSRGNELLDTAFQKLPANIPPSYKPADTQRRLRISKIVLTLYRAEIDVFASDMQRLTMPPSLYIPAINRGRGRNPWANTRIAAVAALPDILGAIHYVCPSIGKLLLPDELAAFSNNTAVLGDKLRALLFAGESYTDILAELDANADETGSRLISYGEAYRRSPLPVYLLSCDETGVIQLRIMAQPNYREALTRAVLKGRYQPPAGRGCDALFDGAPFYLAADMELRRIDAACLRQKENGGKMPAIAALETQTETVLNKRYRDTGLARVFAITDATLLEFLGPPPPSPADRLFITPKGDVLHAPLIHAHRKTGGPRRP